MPAFQVSGIVSQRDGKPYVHVYIDGVKAQLSTAEARNVAMDIIQMSSRAEADAMIYKFFKEQDFPSEAAMVLMRQFRDFRRGLDEEKVERTYSDPDVKENE